MKTNNKNEVKLDLNSYEKTVKFINMICKQDGDFDLSSGRYLVDAKSVIGVFALDLSKPVTLYIHDNNFDKKLLDEFLYQSK